MPLKEDFKRVEKVWGEEVWLVNNESYCGKLLLLDEGAKGSYHYHRKKKETFYCLQGACLLLINGKEYMLTPVARPKTILPGEPHQLIGESNAVILEVSTNHSEDDVVRLTKSQGADESIIVATKDELVASVRRSAKHSSLDIG